MEMNALRALFQRQNALVLVGVIPGWEFDPQPCCRRNGHGEWWFNFFVSHSMLLFSEQTFRHSQKVFNDKNPWFVTT